MSSAPLRVGITIGDINGIGLECALRAASRLRSPGKPHLILIGSTDIIQKQARALNVPLPHPWKPGEALSPMKKILIWDPVPNLKPRWTPGRIDPMASVAAAEWIRAAVKACLNKELDAMVTAPICKEGFHRAGIDTPGHTEMIAALTGSKRFAMMLYGGALRVVLATRHIPLSDVSAHITRRLVTENIRITDEALRWMGVARRRIAVCGLNPHAGEGGDIGKEDRRVIAPAIRVLKQKGIDVHGPLPGDTVFHFAAIGMYDAVIAMYHDQGLAPLKLHAFDRGVNVTLGLPIVRTSPDHGTAFDLAGKGLANPSSMVEAIRQATLLAGQKNPWKLR